MKGNKLKRRKILRKKKERRICIAAMLRISVGRHWWKQGNGLGGIAVTLDRDKGSSKQGVLVELARSSQILDILWWDYQLFSPFFYLLPFYLPYSVIHTFVFTFSRLMPSSFFIVTYLSCVVYRSILKVNNQPFPT